MSSIPDSALRVAAKTIHEAKIRFCWGQAFIGKREPWPDKLPGDFGYVPQPWVDVAYEQAEAVLALCPGQP